MPNNAEAIQRIRNRTPSDAEALAQMFESPSIQDDRTPAGRLRAILVATEHPLIPGLQTGIAFHDRGFRAEFRDPWPSSDNQVGHFLTAVGLSFNPAKVGESFFGARLRDWMRAPLAMSAEEVALRLTIGHEKRPDPSVGTVVAGATGGLGEIAIPAALGGIGIPAVLGGIGILAPFVIGPVDALEISTGPVAGAARAVLNAFRVQFAACTQADIQVFRSAERALGTGRPLNIAAAQAMLRGIRVVPTMRGNSYEDLLLSLYGWRLGQDIRRNQFRTGAEVAAWIRSNLM
jgi:hypothetical protein